MSVRLLVVATALVSAYPAVAGCTGSEPDPPAPEPDRGSTLAQVATESLTVPRGPWCAEVPEAAVERALAGPVAESSTWASGDRVRVSAGLRDVLHEDGCAFTAEDGAAARAWVFAPPVTPARARSLVRAAANTAGCTPVTDASGFGTPSTALLCDAEGSREASYRGLFGDTWLTCTLAAPLAVEEQDLLDRADRWCAAVAQTPAGS